MMQLPVGDGEEHSLTLDFTFRGFKHFVGTN